MSKKITELFAATKGNLKIVDKIAGNPIYSSAELQLNYLRAMEKSGRVGPIMKKLRELVKNNRVIPAYTTDSFFKSILKKRPLNMKGTVGFSVGSSGLIYILVETEANIFSFTNNDSLAIITIHELTHTSAKLKSKSFYNLFKSDLENFYSFYFSKLFSCDPKRVDQRKLANLIDFIYKGEKIYWLNNKRLKEYFDLLGDAFKEHTTLPANMFERVQTDYIVALKIIQKFISHEHEQEISKVLMSFKHIFSPFYTSYKHVFGIDPLKERYMCYQELWVPSEIICITSISSKPNQKVFKIINTL